MTWSYGAELELSDWDTRLGLPQNLDDLHLFDCKMRGSISSEDYTQVNSNGIAVDPKRRIYEFGGEVQTPPTWTIVGQIKYLNLFLAMHPNATINYRSNLHLHIRVPGLKDDLSALKQITRFNHEWLRKRKILDMIEPIPEPSPFDYKQAALEGAKKRYRRRKRSHHTTLAPNRIEAQLAATTLQEFFEAEVPKKGGKPFWTAQPRCAVNIRQLLQTDTIEFRHWPGTLDGEELKSCFLWCDGYLKMALGIMNCSPYELWRELRNRKFPKFLPYIHWMEERHQRTCTEEVPMRMAQREIKAILRETGEPQWSPD